MFEFIDRTPFSSTFQDIYFSPEDGLEESRHVFIEGNQLGKSWAGKRSYVIGETGFGTGLNFLATWDYWKKAESRPATLHYISIEKHPLNPSQLHSSHQLFPQLGELSSALIESYPQPGTGFHRLWLNEHRVCLTLCFMDVCAALAELEATVDCWYLDGFAPAKNPEMWSKTVFRHLARLSRVSSSIATFTAAGHVRRGLEDAGFSVRKVGGYGRKREMTVGTLTSFPQLRVFEPWRRKKPEIPQSRSAIVIGAGIAGAQVANKLALRGFDVQVLEQHSDVAQEASGNPRGIVSPKMTAAPSIEEDFSISAYVAAIRQLTAMGSENYGWSQCGVLSLVTNDRKQNQWRNILERGLPSDLVQPVGPEIASEISGISLNQHALYFPLAGWIDPPMIIRQLLEHKNIKVSCDCKVDHIQYSERRWHVQTKDRSGLSEYMTTETLIIACGRSVSELSPIHLPVNLIKGQTTFVKSSELSEKLKCVLQHDGYITPAGNGTHLIGATYQREAEQTVPESQLNQRNIETQQVNLPDFSSEMSNPDTAHFAYRVATPERFPIVGAVPDSNYFATPYSESSADESSQPMLPGLFIVGALGSRGFSTATLIAEILSGEILGEPSPVKKSLKQAVEPVRWIRKQLL